MSISVSPKGRLSIASIVFATDFSPASRNAGFYAATITEAHCPALTIARDSLLREKRA
jgi:hypothetical protein